MFLGINLALKDMLFMTYIIIGKYLFLRMLFFMNTSFLIFQKHTEIDHDNDNDINSFNFLLESIEHLSNSNIVQQNTQPV